MSKRIVFLSLFDSTKYFAEVLIDFKYHTGFAVSQKQKSIVSLHSEFLKYYPNFNILEVSTKSPCLIGRELSAFNLKFYNETTDKSYFIENIFQAAKVFENGGPYKDLLYLKPKDAKRDERLISSGKLVKFSYSNIDWPLFPKTIFYDWIYISALYNKKDQNMIDELIKYNAFTDIEFNQEKSINCQARSVAIFVSLYKKGMIPDILSNIDKFSQIYKNELTQISFLD
ncbi:MAG: hypothetical protein M0R51_04910 [Clostridia bacterium]|nr:hypothetical protein [Clostridia bacterium]